MLYFNQKNNGDVVGMNILVIDVGTSSIRGILYRGNGEKVFVKQVKYQPVHGDDGRVEQPASDFEDALILILQAFTSRIHIFKAEIYCSIFSFAILFLYHFLTFSHTYLQGSFLTAGGSGSDGCPSIGLQPYYALGRNSCNSGIGAPPGYPVCRIAWR